MPFDLPFNAPLAAYQDQADLLWQELITGSQEAAWSFKWMHPRYRGKTVSMISAADLTPSDAQLVVALNYGFATWEDLVAFAIAVQEPGDISTFERAVEAVVYGDTDALKQLLVQYPALATARSCRRHHATLLHYLGANGVENVRQKTPANALEVATLLLDAGAEPDALADLYDGKCTTLSMLVSSSPPAATGVQAPLAELLLDRGAALEGPGSPWSSAIMTALTFGFLVTARTLASRAPFIDYLPMAAGLGDVNRVRELLFDAELDDKQIALALAALHNHVEVVKVLLEAGADPNQYQPEGYHSHATPLHHAAGNNYRTLAELLVQYGAKLDIQDTIYEASPLGWARHGGHEEMAVWLLSLMPK
jgi:hypothetical protein